MDLKLEALFSWFLLVDDFLVELPVLEVVLSEVGLHVHLTLVIPGPHHSRWVVSWWSPLRSSVEALEIAIFPSHLIFVASRREVSF